MNDMTQLNDIIKFNVIVLLECCLTEFSFWGCLLLKIIVKLVASLLLVSYSPTLLSRAFDMLCAYLLWLTEGSVMAGHLHQFLWLNEAG